MTQILEQVAAVSEQLLQFGINREELLLLEATILVNAGMLVTSHIYLLRTTTFYYIITVIYLTYMCPTLSDVCHTYVRYTVWHIRNTI